MREAAINVTRILKPAVLVAVGLALAACADTRAPRTGRIAPAPVPTAPLSGEFNPNAPVVVALLVPTSASNDRARQGAQGIVDAARLARNDLGDPNLDLRIYDTAGSDAGAAAAAAQAVAEGAKLILGPLRGDGARAAGPVAAQAGVNIISFSTTAEAAGDNIWLIGMLPETEADRIVGYASARGYGSLGVFYAETPYGYAAYDAVRDAAARQGAFVAASGSYQRSFEGIQEAAEGYAAQHEASGATAVVLPANGQELQTAASFLNFHGLLSSRQKYLGLGLWNSPATQKEPTLAGGWFAAPDPARVEQFAARFSSAYGRSPGEFDALGYDAVAAAGALLKDARVRNATDAFSAASITDPIGFAGVNGVFRFTADGLNQRGLAVLEVQPDGFIVIDPAPGGFGAGF
jgi:ABC-type branched-subunit amino acid transport system substrate-binding protein